MDGPAAEAPDAKLQRTSLALLIQTLFQKLSVVSQSQPPALMEARWRAVLGLSVEADLYLPLSHVERVLNRLQCQVDALPPGWERNKLRYSEALNNLRAAMQPITLARDWSGIAPYVTAERLERLDMLADILEQVAPETLPVEGIIPELLSKLDEIAEAIEAAPLPAHARLALRARLGALRWAAVNWHLVGSGAVADAAGALGYAVGAERSQMPVADGEKLFAATMGALDWIGRYTTARDIVQGSAALFHSLGGAGLIGNG